MLYLFLILTLGMSQPVQARPETSSSLQETALDNEQELSMPTSIRVRITGKWECDLSAPYKVVTIDFKDYVKNVLPNEWEAGWPVEAYKVGAIAVKMYAWYWIAVGGKWSDADVYDSTCDQWYRPGSHQSITSQAVEDTWHWKLSRNGNLFPTRHKHSIAHRCKPPFCLSQVGSKAMALEGYTWDQILLQAYPGAELSLAISRPAGFALSFNGQFNKVLIPLITPSDFGPDGAISEPIEQDFTIEWWVKIPPGVESAPRDGCSQDGKKESEIISIGTQPGYSISLVGGRMVIKTNNLPGVNQILCSSTSLLDEKWRHIAVQRRASDGQLWLFVDGQIEASAGGFDGILDDDSNNPYLLIAGNSSQPFYGLIDELRISHVLRYSETFTLTQETFTPDDVTHALYHFDEGYGNMLYDAVGQNNSSLLNDGSYPLWILSDLFLPPQNKIFLPFLTKKILRK